MPSGRAVSVVIPTFNRQGSLTAAIRSVLAQTPVEIEVLVCDDGSEDESANRVAQIGDDRVRWLPGAHTGGPAGPRNRGIAAASHPWVAFLDSDDTWRPDKLSKQLDALARSQALASATNARRLVAGVNDRRALHQRLPPTITLRDELTANLVATSSMVVRTELVRRLGGFPQGQPLRIFEDYALWLRIAQTCPIVVVDELLVDYLDESQASLRGRMSTQFRCTANAFRDFVCWRRTQSPRITTTPAEIATMLRQLTRLVSVRDLVSSRAQGVRPSGA